MLMGLKYCKKVIAERRSKHNGETHFISISAYLSQIGIQRWSTSRALSYTDLALENT